MDGELTEIKETVNKLYTELEAWVQEWLSRGESPEEIAKLLRQRSS